MRDGRGLDAGGDRPRFLLLGPVRVQRGDDSAGLGSPQQLAVACVLLLNAGRLVTTQQLIDALWGEEPPPRSVGAVRTYVSRLRALFEPGRPARSPGRILTSVADGYLLRVPAEDVDALRFEQAVASAESGTAEGQGALAEALALWEGVPLAGATGPYAEAERRRLAELRLRAQEAWLEGELSLGRASDTVAELTALSAEHPLREHLRGLLMQALYRSGRQAEAFAVYTDTRRILVDELGVEPGPELAALHGRMLAGDPDLAPAPHAEGVSALPLTPAQLPIDIADFTGRSKLISELSDILRAPDSRTVVISALAGIGGVGKTTLAVHTAHRIRSDFPDGQLYADLAGAGPSPTDPATVLGDFLRTLGVPAREVPDGSDRRSAMYRTLLADRRLLVVLDNARDAAQVRPLLPGTAGCAVVVTSRARMAGLAGVRAFDVDVMEEDEALQLFATIAGPERVAAEPEAARQVVGVCSRLPLAVRIVASRLAARPGWTVATLAERLADQRRRLDELHVGDLAVEATFHLGYTQLTPEQARAFRLLALPDGPDFSRASAAALLGTDEYGAEDLAESLVDAGLLESPEPGRYRYHDLIRLYARRQSERHEDPKERELTLHRLMDHFQATVRCASRLLEPNDVLTGQLPPTTSEGCTLETPEEAHSWLAAEHAGLLALAEQTVRERTGGPRTAVDLLFTWLWLIEARMYRRDLERVLTAAIQAAGAAADLLSEIRARFLLGVLGYLGGDYTAAEAELRSAAQLLAASDLAEGITRYGVANTLGVVLSATNRPAEAIPLLEEARTYCSDNPPGAARTLANLARAHLAAGQPEQARETVSEALVTARASVNPMSIADTLYQFAIVLRLTGSPDIAAEHLREALVLYRRQQRLNFEGLALARLAECNLDLGELPDAIACAEQALSIGRETNGAYCQGLAQAALGFAFVRSNQTERGRSCLQEAHAIFAGINVPESATVLSQLDELAAHEAQKEPTHPAR
ncbi:AfsR/SARP family transcriptional regulator [Phaeacidiphilus oryzae]|uniref:AfsR/SARP family transcriptional regulator n=1 Tax=Phaeacidiphilus oryzae TaxID=348818 RepID=UPI0006912090|nr:AfsR/SARP family transcriptional regulator [Phaeacidiphilus oryzae]